MPEANAQFARKVRARVAEPLANVLVVLTRIVRSLKALRQKYDG